MGSFANSVHVKCDDANEVVASVANAMRDAGYDPTDEQPDEEATWGMASPLRALHISEPYNGWVGVLDSDLMESASLASDLSRRLETHTIQFLVNDSDAWHYVLFGYGSQIDAFDSSGGLADEYEMDETSPELTQMLLGGELENRMRDFQKQMEDEMPADIRDMQQRIQQGRATQDEMQRFGQWIQAESQRVMGDLMSGMMPSFGSRSAPESELISHIKKLRPILPPDRADSAVLEVLGKQAVFAEEVLGEFMEQIGIQPFFANLSYRYLEECTTADLLASDINLVGHLKFKTGSTAG